MSLFIILEEELQMGVQESPMLWLALYTPVRIRMITL